jgi:hypothetical protein
LPDSLKSVGPSVVRTSVSTRLAAIRSAQLHLVEATSAELLPIPFGANRLRPVGGPTRWLATAPGRYSPGRVDQASLVQLRAVLSELARIGDDDNLDPLRCLSVADWFLRRFAPEMLRFFGEAEYAEVFEMLPEVIGAAAIDRAIRVCSSMTYLVEGETERVFQLVVGALEILDDDPRVNYRADRAASPSTARAFGRCFAQAMRAAARAMHGGGPDDGVLAVVDATDDLPDGPFEELLELMVAV